MSSIQVTDTIRLSARPTVIAADGGGTLWLYDISTPLREIINYPEARALDELVRLGVTRPRPASWLTQARVAFREAMRDAELEEAAMASRERIPAMGPGVDPLLTHLGEADEPPASGR